MRQYLQRAILLSLLAVFCAPTISQPVAPNTAATIERSSAVASSPVRVVPSEKSQTFVASAYRTFEEWKAVCDRLPFNRQLRRGVAPKELLPLKSFREFSEVLEGFLTECKSGTLAQPGTWVDEVPSATAFFNTEKVYFQKSIPFQPFAQKLVLPEGAEVVIHGDFHGDVHSLNASLDWLNKNKYLQGFKLAHSNLFMLFLGDYTDRGMYGVEVLYTIFRLKLENPNHVWMARGNHEDVSLAANYGFLGEIQAKYGREFNTIRLMRAYDFLPAVIYLGHAGNFLQCNHGGMEPGFNPAALLDTAGTTRFQLLGRLNQARFIREHPDWIAAMDPSSKRIATEYLRDFQPENPVTPNTLGFMWNDFSIVPGEPALGYDPGRAFIYGERSSEYILRAASRDNRQVRAVFRAHQHSSLPNAMMRRLKASNGLFRHWQPHDSLNLLPAAEPKLEPILERSEERNIPAGSVWTFNVAPDTVYGEGCEFNFDTFGILKVREKFEDWRIKVVNVPVMRPAKAAHD